MKHSLSKFAKKALLSIFVLLSYISGYSVNYYVSNLGNDLNSGLSPSSPWKTLLKVNSASLKSGDAVLFRNGDTFFGPLISSTSYITFGAYGTGAKPIISGFQTITGWVSQGNGIYAATTIAKVNCNIVTVNGVNTPMGRYPKTGWLTFESFVGRTSITDAQLLDSPNWTGAEVVIKKNDRTIDRSKITNHSGSVISYTSGSDNNPTTEDSSYNYFIQKSINALTQLGDWYCDGNKLYMFFGSNSPNNYKVQASVVDNLIDVNSRNTNIFKDIAIEGSNVNGINIYLSVNIQFINCDFNNHGAVGILASGSQRILVEGCNISSCNGKGIDINAISSVIRNCKINNIAMIPGMGEANGASYLGVKLGSTNGIVEYNGITNCGYIPIYFTGNNSKVRYNTIDKFCSLITDGAGILTYNYSSIPASIGLEVYRNVIMNGGGNGLYSNGVANHVTFRDNTIFNMAKNGIHLNTPISENVSNNLFYNCSLSGISIQNIYAPETNTVAADNFISNNIIVKGTDSQLIMNLFDAKTYSIGNFGASNNNTFVVPSEGSILFKTEVKQPSAALNSYNFANWKTFSKQELSSIQKVTILSEIRFEYNTTTSPKTIALSIPMVDLKGIKYSTSITLQPFTSTILLKDLSLPTEVKPGYYVSSNGNDSNTGRSPDSPWKTLAKVNSTLFKSGDVIYFRRGDTFPGTLISSGSYITFDAYDTGEKPVITGFQTITGWVSQGNGIYAAPTTAKANCNMVTVDGVNTPMGRYPKTGWLTFESFIGKTAITDLQLTSLLSGLLNGTSWTGAEVVIKKNNWTIDRNIITSLTSNVITYGSATNYTPVSVYGNYHYFLQNSKNTLTQLGDWYCDGSTFYMYFGTNNPNNYIVKASAVDKTIMVNSKNSNTFQNLTIEGSNATGISVYLSINIQFKNCDIINHGTTGIWGGSSTEVIVDGCKINDCNGKGIEISAAKSIIRNCNIKNIGVIAGMGEKSGISYVGLKLGSLNGITEYNEISNCGYIPIHFSGNYSKVRYNKVDNYCLFITDGAGIYTHDLTSTPPSEGMEVHNNIVMNGVANGLYSDGASNNISFHDNTIFNIAKNGIHMNTPKSNNVSNNLIYNCTSSGISFQNLYDPEAYSIAANNVIGNNIIAQGVSSQLLMSLADAKTYNIGNFGSSNNNIFVVGSDGLNMFKTQVSQPGFSVKYYNFPNWKTFSNQELSSVQMITDLTGIQLEYNASKSVKTIPLNAPMIDPRGNKYSSSVTLQPYTSVLLMNDLNLKSGSIVPEKINISTSDKNLDDNESIEVFPNPTKGKITVRLPQILIEGSRIDILDLKGRKIFTRVISGNFEEFELGGQPKGLYFVKIVLGTEQIIRKLVIN